MFSKFMFLVTVFVVGTATAAPIKFMHYNVENLFDAKHDDGKMDWEYLPKETPGKKEGCIKQNPSNSNLALKCVEADWTEARLKLKLQQLCKVIRAAHNGALPDMLSLVEVENESVVAQLAKTCGMQKWVVTNSPDERGIDVALVYNESPLFKIVENKSHRLPVEVSDKPTRDILEVITQMKNGTKVHIFVNHWASQSAPAKVRVATAEFMMKQIDAVVAADPKAQVIAVGDYNVINEDRPDPFYDVVTNPKRDGVSLRDLDRVFRGKAREFKINTWDIPMGTYFFGGSMSWNMLDRVFLSPKLLTENNVSVNVGSYKIFTNSEIATDYKYTREEYLKGTVIKGTPKSYDHNASNAGAAGFSDHFPVLFELNVTE